jgi:hypothetical protein
LVGAGRFERPTPCAQGGCCDFEKNPYFQHILFQRDAASSLKAVELCGTLGFSHPQNHLQHRITSRQTGIICWRRQVESFQEGVAMPNGDADGEELFFRVAQWIAGIGRHKVDKTLRTGSEGCYPGLSIVIEGAT